jgi:predicted ATPase/DNA-binding CsgD family transcriptional regulator
MARSTPTVRGGTLFYLYDGQDRQVSVGSSEWYDWLDAHRTFAFRGDEGSFTARRERAGNKRGGWYWKAYVKREKRLRHAYLGKTESLTLERLHSAANELARAATPVRVDAAPREQDGSSFLPRYEAQDILQTQLTAIIGREQETGAACALLLRPDVRLVTITGPGGVGKTRLALHVANALAQNFSDGIRCISLATIADAALVIPTLAQDLGFVEAGDEPLLTRLQRYLRSRHLLLLLDNFEHVIAAAPLLAELLSACPSLKMLVTSREVLHLRIEHELPVPPLEVPATQPLPDINQLSRYAAVELFVQRARAARSDFQITPLNAQAIAEICACLDGLPLALELAAARIKLFSPQQLLTRLEHRLHVLVSGPRDLPMRQQTLRNTLTWSYDLLDSEEQRLFRSLAVFVRGCTFEAIEAFYRALHIDDAEQLLRCIASLTDKNLLQHVEQDNGEMRLMMLGTVREYAQECLLACDETSVARSAHASYYLSLAEEAEAQLRKERQVEWFNRLEQEYDNIRAALNWLQENDTVEDALRLCRAMLLFWLVRDRCSEGLQWVERALVKSERVPLTLRAHAWYAAGTLSDRQGLHQRGRGLWEESLVMYQELNDQPGIVNALNKLGLASARNAPSEAHTLYKMSLKLAQQCEYAYGVVDATMSLADEALALADFARARTLYSDVLELSTTLGDKRSIAYSLSGLGQVLAQEGGYAEAHALLEESLRHLREIGDRVGVAFCLLPLGMVSLYLGDYSTGYALLGESLAVSKELGNQKEIATYLVQYPQTEQKKPAPGSVYIKKPGGSIEQALGILGKVALQQGGENEPARALLEESLAIFRETGNEEGIASKFFALGSIEFAQGNFPSASRLLSECIDIFRKLENRVMTESALHLLGHLEMHRGNYAGARIIMEESVALSRKIGDRWLMSSRLCYLGLVALNEGNYAEARPLLLECVALAREIGDERFIADALGVMGLLPLYEGDYETAQRVLEESLAIGQARKDIQGVSYRLADLGTMEILRGNIEKARSLIDEALAISMKIANSWFIASCLERLGEIVVRQGQAVWAAQLWGAAAAVREAIDAPIPPIERALYEQALRQARSRLGEEAFAAQWQTGYERTPQQVLAQQQDAQMSAQRVESTDQSSERNTHSDARPAPKRTVPLPPIPAQNTEYSPLTPLTNRERDVMCLLVEGATNREIAQQLIISEGTVKKHVSNICSKFGVQRRTQLITRAQVPL